MKKNNFMEGAMIATIAIIISKVLGVLYVIPFYSIIGSKGGALYGYAYNIYNVFLIISSAGIPLAISKITAEYEAKKEYAKKSAMYELAKKVISIFSLASFLICFIFAKPIATLILGDLTGGNTIADVTFVIRCVSFALLVVPMLSISRGYLQGHNYIAPSSLSQVIEQLARIIVIIVGSYVSIKVLKIPLTYAVGISVFAACIGAIIAYIYLLSKMKKLKKEEKVEYGELNKKDKKEIISKLIGYSVPFIIINVAKNLYNTTDMILLIRGLNMLNFPAEDIETISSVFTTWGNKLTSIVNAFATGLVISLIPSIVKAYNNKNEKEVNSYFNKSLQVLLFVILPITIFMSIFADNVWTVFYGKSYFGPIIFKYTVIVALLDCAYIMICSALQGLYKTKLIYIAVASGLIVNLILDIPFMFLFNKFGLYPYYGAITATVVGYIISLGIPLIVLNKKDHISYKETIKTVPKLALSIIILIIVCLVYKHFFSVGYNRFMNILYLAAIGIVSMAIYYILNMKIINELLGTKIKKFIKK